MPSGAVMEMTPPPLTKYCMLLSVPENLLNAANGAMTNDSSETDKRAIVLFLIIMSAAGNFVESFRWDEQPMWEGSGQFLRDTNLDVITAEAIVWITFLIGKLRLSDQKKNREMFERVGHVTVSTAGRLALAFIESSTDFDFTERAKESRKLYSQSAKDHTLAEAFASVLLRSIGCGSFAEAPKMIGPLPPLVWTPINMAVGIFFSTMPLAAYDTFKNMLRDYSNLFPHDKDDFDD